MTPGFDEKWMIILIFPHTFNTAHFVSSPAAGADAIGLLRAPDCQAPAA